MTLPRRRHIPSLPRLHLVELHERPSCPSSLRDGLTDVLAGFASWLDLYAPAVPILVDALRRTGERRVVDLCAGAGGAWPRLIDRVRAEVGPVEVCVTDLYPSASAERRLRDVPDVIWHPDPVDATAVPADLPGFRTLWTSFHHFAPEDARRVLADAVAAGHGIAVFEVTRRSLRSIVHAATLGLLVPLIAPFLRPFRLSRLFWAWVCPVLPVLVALDSIVSCLRTYEPEELLALAHRAGGKGWRWRAGRAGAWWHPEKVTWLVGLPPEADPPA